MKDKGLGDTIENITTKTGIKKVVKILFGENCGCEERKDKLNKLFPYKKVSCLTEEEYNYLNSFGFETNTLDNYQQNMLLKIYNRIFNENKKATTCSSCWKNIINELKIVFEEYKQS